jgi:hypothetical protein
LFINTSNGQNFIGRVTEEQSDDPISAAHIFFANYQSGTYSDDSGYFDLQIPDEFPLQLVISHVTYNSKTINIDSYLKDSVLNVQLTPRVEALEEVNISASIDKEWNRSLKHFIGAFLGNSENSRKCSIVNPHVINFTNEDGLLRAVADNLIVIENLSTGYKLHFLLEYFSMKKDLVSFSGKPYFDALDTENMKEKSRWIKNRKETFYGSKRHFYITLLKNNTFAEGFEIISGRIDNNNDFIFRGLINSNDLITHEKGKTYFNLNNTLKVVYTRERDPGRTTEGMERFSIDNYNQISYITSRISKIRMHDNGILYRPDLIQVSGYWAREGVADLLPFDYYPEE